MKLNEALKDPKSEFNFILRPGDIITIPTTNDLVSISGMINFPYADSWAFKCTLS
jgi:hypothetical protein